MANMQRPGGLARWEYAIYDAVMFVIPASVLIVMAAILGGYGDASPDVRNLAHLAVITVMIVDMIVMSLAFWVPLRYCPPVMNPWRICAATAFFAYALGSTYELLARELIGHPLPTLEQLAPGVMAFLPAVSWMVAIILFGWGLLAALGVRRAMQRDARQ